MAQLLTPFDANKVDPSQGSGSLPVGKHPVIIEASEIKATSSNDGGLLELLLRIIDGPLTGTTGAYRLNLYNKSEKAAEIANRQLSAICHVTGVFNVQDSSQLHNIPFVVEVGMQKGEEAVAKGYTEVKKVFDINGNEPGKAGNGAAQHQPAQQQAQNNPVGGFGSNAPNPQGGFGQQQQPQNQGGANWGGQQQPAQQQQQPAQQTAWGGQQQTQQQQPPAQQQGQGGWQQNQGGGAGGQPAPWGAK